MDSFGTLVGMFGYLFPEFGYADVGIVFRDDGVSFTSATPTRKSPCVGFFSEDGVADRVDECMRSLVRYEKRHEKTYANAVTVGSLNDSPRTFALRYLWAGHAMRAKFERDSGNKVFLDSAWCYYLGCISLIAGVDFATQASSGLISTHTSRHSRMLSEAFAGLCLVETHRDSNETALAFAIAAVALRPRAVALVNCARIVALANGNHDLAMRLTGRVILPLLDSATRAREFALWPSEMRIMIEYIEKLK